MTAQEHNKLQGIDPHIVDLINGSIDGELSVTEQNELADIMAESEQACVLNAELRAVTELLDQVPEREPPAYLQSAIERQIRLPLPRKRQGRVAGFFKKSIWTRSAFALTAGVVLSVGVIKMGSEPMTAQDAARMTGTMAKAPGSEQGELLDSIRIDSGSLSAHVQLRNLDDLYTLDVQLTSVGPLELTIDFTGRGLEFTGLLSEGDGVVMHPSEDGSINLASDGAQSYILQLRRTGDIAKAAPLELEFYSGDRMVQEAELSISQ